MLMQAPKGKRYQVAGRCSISTPRGTVQGGGYVYESDFPEGNLEALLAQKPCKLVLELEPEPKVEKPEPEPKPKRTRSRKKKSEPEPEPEVESESTFAGFGRSE
jgi:hypothetical protein